METKEKVPCDGCITLSICKNLYNGLKWSSLLGLCRKCSIIDKYTKSKIFPVVCWNVENANKTLLFLKWIK